MKTPYKRPTNEELAWAAGFFDGEGNVSFNFRSKERTSTSFRFTLQIGQKQEGICCGEPYSSTIEKFHSIFPFGKIYIRPNSKYPNSTMLVFGVSSFELCQQVIVSMWPWLGDLKKDQWRTLAEGVTKTKPLYANGKATYHWLVKR